jgi:hypothetical protein
VLDIIGTSIAVMYIPIFNFERLPSKITTSNCKIIDEISEKLSTEQTRRYEELLTSLFLFIKKMERPESHCIETPPNMLQLSKNKHFRAMFLWTIPSNGIKVHMGMKVCRFIKHSSSNCLYERVLNLAIMTNENKLNNTIAI